MKTEKKSPEIEKKPDIEKKGEGWFYSDTVKEHFLHPKNLMKNEEEYRADGVGQVGSPACGDVMRMWIKVDRKEDKIIDCKWLTFGCMLGSTRVMTPKGRKKIKDLKFGGFVWGWDGNKIVKAKVLGLVEREVEKEDLINIQFKRKENTKSTYKLYVTKDHLFFINNKWVKASKLKKGNELFHIPEQEWRSLNNVGRKNWLKKENSLRLKNNNPMFNSNTVKKTIETYKKLLKEGKILNWMQTGYGKQKTAERMKKENPMFDSAIAKKNRESQDIRPTKLEQIIIDIIKANNLPIRYVGDGKFWITDINTKRCKNPDFKVNHQKKLIEVYVSNYPWQKRDKKWVEDRTTFFKKQGFKTLFLDLNQDKDIKDILEKLQSFLHNGEKIYEIHNINRFEYDQIKESNGKIKVYDLQLTPPHTFFSWRVLSHNCASAIASTSMLSVMITENGGMKIDDALQLRPKQIIDRLGGLPVIKIHCSVLGDQALREAIKNYFRKSGQEDRLKKISQ